MGARRERAVAFVVARLNSARLPQKQLRTIGGKPIINHILDSLKNARELDEVVIATVAERDNEPLRDIAEQAGVGLFWYEGRVDDVTTRLRLAAEGFDADICLLISADCPLIHGPSIDEIVGQFRLAPEADFVTLPHLGPDRHQLLEGVQVARRSAWQRADDISDRPELREHQFPVLYRNPELFSSAPAHLDESIYGKHHRMSVDTWADLEFMETLFEHLSARGLPFELPHAVKLLEERPELREINGHVHQRALIEDLRDVLIMCDAGGQYGYGHFMRCRELAGQIVERLSWPVTFYLDDERAAQMAEECGFHVLWGALEREPEPPPQGRQWLPVREAAATHGCVIVDISARRTPHPGWRERMAEDVPVVIIDREDAPAAEADMIVFPGVTGRREGDRSGLPHLVEGLPYVILRREVRRYAGLAAQKDIDVLAYLYPEEQRAALQLAAEENGWNVEILSGFTEEFPKLLARSRVFISGYGQTFYEALSLGAVPACWPLSGLHRADAASFYRAVALPPAIIEEDEQLAAVIGPLLANSHTDTPSLEDGTPAIVAEIATLCRSWGEND